MFNLQPFRSRVWMAWLWLIFSTLPACQHAQTPETEPSMADRSFAGKVRAPEFPPELPWLNTKQPLSLKDLRGKIVLLDFWTYCCINCMHVLPDLKRLEHEFPELVVIGVHSAKFPNEGDAENVRQAILRYDIEHPVVVDSRFYLWQQYAIKAWPSFALIDPTGRVVGNLSGEGVYDRLRPVLQAMQTEFAERLDTTRMTFALERHRRPASWLAYPGKLETDTNPETGPRLFITDSNHNRILVCTPDGQLLDIIGSGVSGQADGAFDEAQFFRPQGLAWDAGAQVLYIADTDNHLIRRADFRNRTVETLAGTGTQSRQFLREGQGTDTPLNSPWDLALRDGTLYIAMAGPHQLWTMDPETRRLEVYAGSGHENLTDGPRLEAALAQPSGLTFGPDGTLYFADSEVSAIRAVDGERVRTLIGEGLFEFGDIDGKYHAARLQHVLGVHWHEGKIYVADTYNHKVKVLDPEAKTVETLIGTGERGHRDGPAGQAQLNEPNDLHFLDGRLYITDTNNDLIRVYDPATGEVSTYAWQNPAQLSMLTVRTQMKTEADGAEVPFFGRTIELAAVEIGSHTPELDLTLYLPEGFKVNPQAPHFLNILSPATAENPAFETGPDLPQDRFRAQVRLLLPAPSDSGTLTLEAGVYYCETDREARCLIEDLRLVVPYQVVADGTETLRLEHTLTDRQPVSAFGN